MIKKASIFCASSNSVNPKYLNVALEVGRVMADLDIETYTGGGNSGLMEQVADGVLQSGGRCIGVIPQFMIDRDWLYDGLSEVIKVETMAERKSFLQNNTDASIMIAGGIGTLDEFFDTLVLKQLGKYLKPIIIVNTDGYFDHLLAMLDKMIDDKFLQKSNKSMWQVISSPYELPQALSNPNEWSIEDIRFDYNYTQKC